MKLTFVFGTRPETIKLAPLILEARRKGHEARVILTGQHRHMALPLLKFFGITPDLDLDVMQEGQTLTGLSARVLEALDRNADQIRSDLVLVQGDTTSAFVSAYWAFCHRIPVAHVEAGLRTYDLTAPFPEEANRQLIGRVASIHFAPTTASVRALRKENVDPKKIVMTGNSAIDALQYTLKHAETGEVPAEERLSDEVARFADRHPMVLVTAHRRESFGEGFEGICKGILKIADARKDVRIVYPVHPNPSVREPVKKHLGQHPRILLCDPVPYVGFVSLMERARVLLTDSGGIQEEGPTLRKPILVMRNTTERPEGVKLGFAKLVGTSPEKISRESLRALDRARLPRGKNPYGDGKASERMIRAIEKRFGP